MSLKTFARIAASALSSVSVAMLLSVPPLSAQSRWGANYFPNVPLTTQDGKTVHFYDDVLKGKTVAINLIYTNCEYSCPLETARLAQVQKLLGDRVGKDIFFYSISIDPERDTPKQLKAYARKFHAGPGWTFLTGKKEDIDLISRKMGIYSDPKATLDGHTPHLLIGNEPTGQWLRNSATDNPRFLATMIGDFMDNWKNHKAATTAAVSQPLNFEKGHYLFATRCAACHTIGHGDGIGPDLVGVTDVRDRAWLARIIATPNKMLAEKDPIATALFRKYKQVRMPTPALADPDVAAIIEYMKKQSDAASGAGTAGMAGDAPIAPHP